MSVSASFDLLLRGGHVICPASGIDGVRDVAIRNGKIVAVQADILPTGAREVVDVTGRLVLPGLIDTHAHVYQYVTGRFGMNADMVGVESGVTTLVDQGGVATRLRDLLLLLGPCAAERGRERDEEPPVFAKRHASSHEDRGWGWVVAVARD